MAASSVLVDAEYEGTGSNSNTYRLRLESVPTTTCKLGVRLWAFGWPEWKHAYVSLANDEDSAHPTPSVWRRIWTALGRVICSIGASDNGPRDAWKRVLSEHNESFVLALAASNPSELLDDIHAATDPRGSLRAAGDKAAIAHIENLFKTGPAQSRQGTAVALVLQPQTWPVLWDAMSCFGRNALVTRLCARRNSGWFLRVAQRRLPAHAQHQAFNCVLHHVCSPTIDLVDARHRHDVWERLSETFRLTPFGPWPRMIDHHLQAMRARVGAPRVLQDGTPNPPPFGCWESMAGVISRMHNQSDYVVVMSMCQVLATCDLRTFPSSLPRPAAAPASGVAASVGQRRQPTSRDRVDPSASKKRKVMVAATQSDGGSLPADEPPPLLSLAGTPYSSTYTINSGDVLRSIRDVFNRALEHFASLPFAELRQSCSALLRPLNASHPAAAHVTDNANVDFSLIHISTMTQRGRRYAVPLIRVRVIYAGTSAASKHARAAPPEGTAGDTRVHVMHMDHVRTALFYVCMAGCVHRVEWVRNGDYRIALTGRVTGLLDWTDPTKAAHIVMADAIFLRNAAIQTRAARQLSHAKLVPQWAKRRGMGYPTERQCDTMCKRMCRILSLSDCMSVTKWHLNHREVEYAMATEPFSGW